MSDEHKDVVIAAYLFEDLAKKDFDAVVKLAEDKTITMEGVVLVQKDAEGEVTSRRPATTSAARAPRSAEASDSSSACSAAAPGRDRGRGRRGGRDGQVRKAPARERDRREDGRRPAPAREA